MNDIVFDQRFHDFGTIFEENGIVTAKYDFTNYGNSPFIISAIDAACGCTNPRSSKDTFMPGERGQILAEFNPKGFAGKTKKWIYVRGNFEDGYQIELKFEAEIKSSYNRDNYEYIRGEFGYLLINKIKFKWIDRFENSIFTDTIELSNDGYNPITVYSQKQNIPFIKPLNLPITVPIGEKRKVIFEIDLSLTDTIGPISGYINLTTDDKFYPKKQLPYSINIQTDFISWRRKQIKNAAQIFVSTTTINLGTMNAGSKRAKFVTMSNTGKSPLILRRIDTDCSCTLLNLSKRVLLPGESMETKVSYDSLFKKGKQTKIISIYTNDPNQPIVNLYVKADVK